MATGVVCGLVIFYGLPIYNSLVAHNRIFLIGFSLSCVRWIFLHVLFFVKGKLLGSFLKRINQAINCNGLKIFVFCRYCWFVGHGNTKSFGGTWTPEIQNSPLEF